MTLEESRSVGHDYVTERVIHLSKSVQDDARLDGAVSDLFNQLEPHSVAKRNQQHYRVSTPNPDLSDEATVCFGVKADDTADVMNVLYYDVHHRTSVSSLDSKPTSQDDDVSGRITEEEITGLIKVNEAEYREEFSKRSRDSPWSAGDFKNGISGLDSMLRPPVLPLYDAVQNEESTNTLRELLLNDLTGRRRCLSECGHTTDTAEQNLEIGRQFSHELELPIQAALPDVTLDLILYGAAKQLVGQWNFRDDS